MVGGRVTDAKTGVPIPFAAVQFPQTSIGTTTDFEGFYTLTYDQPFDSLLARVLGYDSRTRAIPKDSRTATINFQLNETVFDLGEVVIRAGENPAHRILREATKRKDHYNFERADGVEYTSYQITDIALTNISEGFKQKRSMRQFVKIFDSLAKVAGEDGSIVLPFFVSENSSKIYRRTSPTNAKEVTIANRSSGYLLDDLNAFAPILGASYQKYNFNNDWLNIFDRNFMSPLADGALLLYETYLLDTVFVNNVFCYELRIKPKNPLDLVFTGTIWIGVEDYALHRISAEIGQSANLNFVRRLTIQQDYERTPEGYSVPVRSRVLVDAIDLPGVLPAGFIVKFNNYYSEFVFGNPKPLSFFDMQVQVLDGADRKTDGFWERERIEKSNDTITVRRSFATIDSIRQNKHIRRNRELLNLLWKGYHPITPNIELGHWATLAGYNKIEGVRLQLTPRTSYEWSNIWQFKGMLAYGFDDNRLKYGIEGSYFFDRNSWTRLTVSYSDDDIKLVSPAFWADVGNFLPLFETFSTQFPNMDQVARSRTINIQLQTDYGRSKTHVFAATHRTFDPYFDFKFMKPNSEPVSEYKVAELSYGLLFAKKRTQMTVGNERYFMGGSAHGNWWEFRYAYAIPLTDDYLTYHRFGLRYRRLFRVGLLGATRVSATASTVLGHVPSTEIVQFQGNSSWFEAYEGYNGMAYNEFIADQALELQAKHHFEGLFFNRIPLFKHLRLREIVGANVIFSRVYKTENLESNPNIFQSMDVGKPYVEVYYSVDNIFKFFRVTAVHRLTYLDHQNIPSLFDIKGFSLKFSANFSL
ncbi:MAG: DUF5686 and carboxypeptidase regulatory-like domain-containing protein [Bacteroidales bacterium]|nr:DUF5686 and carboxypeptidase regulatory-like domain-containing protein [Bacteroidales bacterium]